MWRWFGIGVLLLLVCAVGYFVLTRDATNAKVAEEIRSNPQGERAARTMLLTLADGRMYPVNYLWEENLVFMGIDGPWWREFTGEGQGVEMFIAGQTLTGHARAVLDDPEYTDEIFARLRPKAPSWLPRWLNGKLVVITLAPAHISS